MGNVVSGVNPQPRGLSSAIDSGMMSVLGEQAARPVDYPKYDKSGVGLARPKREAEEGDKSGVLS